MTPQQIVAVLQERFPGKITAAFPDDKHPRVHVMAKDWRPLAEFLRREPDLDFDFLLCLSAVDYVADNLLGSVYDLRSMKHKHEFAVKHLMCASDCETMSIGDLLSYAPGATVRDCRVETDGFGIYIRGASGCMLEGNRISGSANVASARRGNGIHLWKTKRNRILGNTIHDKRDGIYFSFVTASAVRDNDIARVRYGLHYMYSDRNRFEGNLFHENAAGAALMYSKGLTLARNRFVANRSHRAYGLLLQSLDDTVVADNDISGNTLGVFMENGHANRVLGNRITGNHIGIRVSDSSDANVFAGNRFTGNIHPVETTGGNGSNQWALDGRGNEWEGASRIDLDRNGIADLPHRELDLFGEMRRTFPAIGLLAGSPGERLLRFVHARIALPGAGGIVDPSPIVTGASR